MINKIFFVMAAMFLVVPVWAEDYRSSADVSRPDLDLDEQNLWKEVEEFEKQLDKSGLVYEDQALADYVNHVMARVTAGDPQVRRFPIRVRVLKDTSFNAFALPTGAVYVHSGLLSSLENEAQLATVLGHESTHVFHRHSIQQMRSVINKTAFLSALSISAYAIGGTASSTDVRQVADIISNYGNLVVFAAIAGYGRNLERDADREAFQMIVRSGYDPAQTQKAFERMEKVIKDEKSSNIPYLYQSHPRIKERIATYRELLEEKKFVPGEMGDKVYLERVRELTVQNAIWDLKLNKIKRVRRVVDEYLGRYVDDARGLWLKGKIYATEKNFDEAVNLWKKAVDADPDFAEPYKELGIYYYKKKEKDQAKEFLGRYLMMYPGAQDAAYLRRYIDE